MTERTGSTRVHDNAAGGRYEIEVDGGLAGFAEYRDRGGRRVFVHTTVDPEFAGLGIGNQLAAGALDDAAARGLRVVPRCPFIRAFIKRNPRYASLIGPPADGG